MEMLICGLTVEEIRELVEVVDAIHEANGCEEEQDVMLNIVREFVAMLSEEGGQ